MEPIITRLKVNTEPPNFNCRGYIHINEKSLCKAKVDNESSTLECILYGTKEKSVAFNPL